MQTTRPDPEKIIYDPVRDFIEEHYQALSPELQAFRKVGENGNVPIIFKETERFLATILTMKRPKKIVEVGTAIGYSASFFATVCPEAEVYSIEKDEYAFSAAIQNIAKIGLDDRIHLLFGDGQEQIEKLRDQGNRNFDFIFLDASKSSYRRFFESALEIANDSALIICDNIMQHGMTADSALDTKNKHKTSIRNMRAFIDFLCTDKRLTTSILGSGDGLAVSIYNKNK